MVDALPKFEPVMLCGLSWASAKANLEAVDCALRRPGWCSPIVVWHDGKPALDDDGEIKTLRLSSEERHAHDWMMVPRPDDDGNDIPPTYRRDKAQP